MGFMETHSPVALEISTLLKGRNLSQTRKSQNNTLSATNIQLDDKGIYMAEIFPVY